MSLINSSTNGSWIRAGVSRVGSIDELKDCRAVGAQTLPGL